MTQQPAFSPPGSAGKAWGCPASTQPAVTSTQQTAFPQGIRLDVTPQPSGLAPVACGQRKLAAPILDSKCLGQRPWHTGQRSLPAVPTVLLPCACSRRAAPHPMTAKPPATKPEVSQRPLASCKPRLLPLQSTTFPDRRRDQRVHAPSSRVLRLLHMSPRREVDTLGSGRSEAEHPAACVQIVLQILNPPLAAALSWHCHLVEHGFLPWC